jgi:hypothetical protein
VSTANNTRDSNRHPYVVGFNRAEDDCIPVVGIVSIVASETDTNTPSDLPNGVISGWHYRLASVFGAGTITALSLAIANHPLVQQLAMSIPIFNRLSVTTLSNDSLMIATITVLVIMAIALFPLSSPRSRPSIDIIIETQCRVLLAAVVLATIEYFDYTYRLPRLTFVLTMIGLLVFLPAWNVLIQRPKQPLE